MECQSTWLIASSIWFEALRGSLSLAFFLAHLPFSRPSPFGDDSAANGGDVVPNEPLLECLCALSNSTNSSYISLEFYTCSCLSLLRFHSALLLAAFVSFSPCCLAQSSSTTLPLPSRRIFPHRMKYWYPVFSPLPQMFLSGCHFRVSLRLAFYPLRL